MSQRHPEELGEHLLKHQCAEDINTLFCNSTYSSHGRQCMSFTFYLEALQNSSYQWFLCQNRHKLLFIHWVQSLFCLSSVWVTTAINVELKKLQNTTHNRHRTRPLTGSRGRSVIHPCPSSLTLPFLLINAVPPLINICRSQYLQVVYLECTCNAWQQLIGVQLLSWGILFLHGILI